MNIENFKDPLYNQYTEDPPPLIFLRFRHCRYFNCARNNDYIIQNLNKKTDIEKIGYLLDILFDRINIDITGHLFEKLFYETFGRPEW